MRQTSGDFAPLATKQDLLLLEQRIVVKLGGMMVVALGAIAILVKLL